MTHPTQDQLLNAAIMLDGAHPAVAAWLVRMAEQQAAEPVAQVCCGQFETCTQACTPRGKFLGQREALAEQASALAKQQAFVDSLPAGDDKMFEQIHLWAMQSYKRHRGSTAGQQITAADNFDTHIIWAALRWAGEHQAPTQQPLTIGPLARRRIFDYIRGAYDLGYNDARNAKAVPGDGAPGYKGRDVEADHGGALLHALEALGAQTTQQAAEPISTQDDPCPGCQKGGVCKTPTCGRLKLPPDHPFRSTQQAAEPVAVTGCSYCLNKTAYKLTPTCTECGHDMLPANPAPTQQPLTEATVDSLYQRMAADERTKQFTAQNWFQAGVASAEVKHGITGSKEGGAA